MGPEGGSREQPGAAALAGSQESGQQPVTSSRSHLGLGQAPAPLRGPWIQVDEIVSGACSVPTHRRGSPPPGCVYICVCTHMHAYIWVCVSTCVHVCECVYMYVRVVYKALLDNTVKVYVCMHVCVCMDVPMWVWSDSPLCLAPTLVCLLFHHVLPSKVIYPPGCLPRHGDDSLLCRVPACGPLCTGLGPGWGVGRPPQVLIYDIWLRVQPATSFMAGLGGDPKAECHHSCLATAGAGPEPRCPGPAFW